MSRTVGCKVYGRTRQGTGGRSAGIRQILGASEIRGVAYFGVLIIGILLFRVLC